MSSESPYDLRGRVGASKASGTVQVQVTVKHDAGATADTCDTTLLRWSARSTKGAKIKRKKKAEIRVGAAALGHMGTSGATRTPRTPAAGRDTCGGRGGAG